MGTRKRFNIQNHRPGRAGNGASGLVLFGGRRIESPSGIRKFVAIICLSVFALIACDDNKSNPNYDETFPVWIETGMVFYKLDRDGDVILKAVQPEPYSHIAALNADNGDLWILCLPQPTLRRLLIYGDKFELKKVIDLGSRVTCAMAVDSNRDIVWGAGREYLSNEYSLNQYDYEGRLIKTTDLGVIESGFRRMFVNEITGDVWVIFEEEFVKADSNGVVLFKKSLADVGLRNGVVDVFLVQAGNFIWAELYNESSISRISANGELLGKNSTLAGLRAVNPLTGDSITCRKEGVDYYLIHYYDRNFNHRWEYPVGHVYASTIRSEFVVFDTVDGGVCFTSMVPSERTVYITKLKADGEPIFKDIAVPANNGWPNLRSRPYPYNRP